MAEIKQVIHGIVTHVVDAAAFTGLGYLMGHTINYVKGGFNVSFLPAKPLVDVTSGTLCCGFFIVIDQLARLILSLIPAHYLPTTFAFSSHWVALRVVGSGAAAIALTAAVSSLSSGKLAGLPWQAGLLVLSITGIVYTILMLGLNCFNARLVQIM